MGRNVMQGLLLFCLGVWCIGTALPAVGAGASAGFGLGGATIGVLFADLSSINALLGELGYGSIDEPPIVAGGFGRGGALPGPFFGGRGWGADAVTTVAGGSAEVAVGFGGFEFGAALGGNERSVLTVGVVLGAGGASLELHPAAAGPARADDVASRGIVPVPQPASLHRVFAGIEAAVGLHVHPLPWLGLELRLGYFFSPFGIQWGENGLVGDEASLDLSGPMVCLSVAFGGIGAVDPRNARQEMRTVERVAFTGSLVRIESSVGDVTVTSWSPDAVQTGDEQPIQLITTRRAESVEGLEAIGVTMEHDEDTLEIRADLPSRRGDNRGVDLQVTVPAGTRTDVVIGVGHVSVFDAAGSASIKLGTGEITVRQSAGEYLRIDLGVGEIRMVNVLFGAADVRLGAGSIDLRLSPDVSATLDVTIGRGEFAVGSFPGVTPRRSDLVGGRAELELGGGASIWEFDVGIGRVFIGPVGG